MSLTAPAFIATALLSPPGESDATDIAIVNATVRTIGRFGLDRLSIDDVATAAGVGRATVFRRFGSKEELLRRTIAREGATILEQLLASVADVKDPADRFVEFSVSAARLRRDNPLLARLITDGSIIGLMQDPFLLGLARRAAGAQIAAAWPSVDAEAVAEVLMRLFAGLCILPDVGLATNDDDTIRRLARTVLAPLSTTRPRAGHKRHRRARSGR
jgi:AcrR family transcriptional regulator